MTIDPRWHSFDPTGAPESLSELLALDGVREEAVLAAGSRVGFMAIHGGHLEAATDRIALAAAEQAGASAYVVHHPDGLDRHLPSVRYRPAESEALAAFLDHVQVVVSIHGYGRQGWWTALLLGGANRALARALAAELAPRLPAYEMITDLDRFPDQLHGLHRDNPVNATRLGGVQVELPPRIRGTSPLSPPAGPDGWSPPAWALVEGLASFAAGIDRELDAADA